jgi:ferritin-like metal-binding protein YciE
MNATLERMFHDQVRDIYYAERKILKTLSKMGRAAKSPELKEAFDKHRGETEVQIERLQQVFEMLGKRAQGKTCPAIEGIMDEGEEILDSYKDTPLLDTGLIAAAQSVEHYEIARYGTLRTWAKHLGMPEAAKLMQESLDEETATDKLMSTLGLQLLKKNAVQEAA